MTDKQPTENPWGNHFIVGRETGAMPFRFDPGEAREHTLIIGTTAQGMSCLTGMMVKEKCATNGEKHD